MEGEWLVIPLHVVGPVFLTMTSYVLTRVQDVDFVIALVFYRVSVHTAQCPLRCKLICYFILLF